MEWLAKLLGSVTPAKPEGGSLQDGIMGAMGRVLGEAISGGFVEQCMALLKDRFSL